MESYMHLPAEMDHNEFDFMEDLILPFAEFIKRIDDTKTLVKHVKKPEDRTNDKEEDKEKEE